MDVDEIIRCATMLATLLTPPAVLLVVRRALTRRRKP